VTREASQIARFVPELSGARDRGIRIEVGGVLGLFERDLVADDRAWTRLAAVRLDARVQARGVRAVRDAIPVRLAEHARGVPDVVFGADGRAVIPSGEGGVHGCDQCTFRPGFVQCQGCGGTGVSEIFMPTGQTIRERCRACTGSTVVVCSRCEGHAKVWFGEALEVTDRYAELRHVYAPSIVSLGLQEALATMIEAHPMPDALAISLEPRVVDPYRGTLAGHAIAGHGYDEVMPTVRAALNGLAGELEVVRSEVALHAWPFLFACAGDVEAAIAIDHEGALRVLRATPD
jgi:hypothetical protein